MMSINKKEVSKLFFIGLCVSVLTFRKCFFQTLGQIDELEKALVDEPEMHKALFYFRVGQRS